MPGGRLPVVPDGRSPGKRAARERRAPPPDVDAARARAPSCPRTTCAIRMIGIGGTGVVTVSQVLGMAALLDGLHVARARPDRAQPEGRPGRLRPAPPTARRSTAPAAPPRRAPTSTSASTCSAPPTPRNLATADPERTVAVVSTSAVPTGAMVDRPGGRLPELTRARSTRSTPSRAPGDERLPRRAGARRALFGDHMPANTIAARRRLAARRAADLARGARAAIRLNGAAVEQQPRRVRLGPRGVAGPEAVERAPRPAAAPRARAERRRGRADRRGDAGRRRAAPAARGPRARPDRLPGRAATPQRYVGRGRARARGRARSGRRADAADRGGRAPTSTS